MDEEWRDWASLPRDVLCIVLTKLPQTDILRGAGLTCSPWRWLAKNEPLLWRSIHLRDDGDPWYWEDPWDWQEQPQPEPPAGWKAMALAAVDRSAGRCESFTGHVDADVLDHLANRAPLLTSLEVACCIPDMEGVIKKLPLLERLVIGSGSFREELLVALLNHCPRLRLLDATFCDPTFRVWEEPIATRIHNSAIKHLMLPLTVLQ